MRALSVLAVLLLVPGAAGLPWPLPPLSQAPYADFVWSPEGVGAHVNITFTSTSSDPDGIILVHEWTFPGDDGPETLHGTQIVWSFPRGGDYAVALRVVDNTLDEQSVTRIVSIANTPPVLDFIVEPNPVYRGMPVELRGSAEDIDGDHVVGWTWDLGDGSLAQGRNVTHTYTSLGSRAVTLSAVDEAGNQAFVSRMVRVLNQPPQVAGDYTPRPPAVGQTVHFLAEGVDPDVPGGPVSFTWTFSDGVSLSGAHVTRAFEAAGSFSVTLRGQDGDGGSSAPYVMAITVQAAP